jgi:hypothetical protein
VSAQLVALLPQQLCLRPGRGAPGLSLRATATSYDAASLGYPGAKCFGLRKQLNEGPGDRRAGGDGMRQAMHELTKPVLEL